MTVRRDMTSPPATNVAGGTPIDGLDGKTYQRPVAEPAKPKRRPLTEQSDKAGWDLHKATERLVRITDDDRFTANRS